MENEKDTILYIDDDQTNLMLFSEVFKDKYEVFTTMKPEEAMDTLQSEEVKVAVVDYFMPEISGLDFISKAVDVAPDCYFIILTAYPDLEVTINAINQGNVYRFLSKPWKEYEVDLTIQNAIETYNLRIKNKDLVEDLKHKNRELTELKERLEDENLYLQEEIRLNVDFENIISRNKNFKKVLKEVEQVSSTQATVLVLGETGTGKELVARSIHSLSKRNDHPFIKINCAAIPETLIESELFGHVKGAFTGAVSSKKGRFELADRGTIFLDEIGELPMALQPKLLRVLQDGEFEPVGGTNSVSVDVRIVAATNRNLEEEMEKGNFRSDLYYRLHVFPIHIPPLRERPDDIPLLVNHFMKKFNRLNGKNVETVSKKVMKSLTRYHWPGNIRELENTIERAVIISQGTRLELGYHFLSQVENGESSDELLPLDEVEKRYILRVLEHTNWRISGEKGAADILNMKPTTLDSRLKKLGITRPE